MGGGLESLATKTLLLNGTEGVLFKNLLLKLQQIQLVQIILLEAIVLLENFLLNRLMGQIKL